MILNSSIDSSVGVESSVMSEPTSTLEAPSSRQLTALRRAPLMEDADGAGEADAHLVGQAAAHTGHQGRELHEVAVVERKLLDLRGPHQVLHGGGGLDELRGGRDLHRLRQAAGLERHVQLQPVVDVQVDGAGRPGLEAGEGEGHLVTAGRKESRGIEAFAAGQEVAGPARARVPHRHRRSRDEGARRVGDGARDRGGDLLRAHRRGQTRDDERGQAHENPEPHRASTLTIGARGGQTLDRPRVRPSRGQC